MDTMLHYYREVLDIAADTMTTVTGGSDVTNTSDGYGYYYSMFAAVFWPMSWFSLAAMLIGYKMSARNVEDMQRLKRRYDALEEKVNQEYDFWRYRVAEHRQLEFGKAVLEAERRQAEQEHVVVEKDMISSSEEEDIASDVSSSSNMDYEHGDTIGVESDINSVEVKRTASGYDVAGHVTGGIPLTTPIEYLATLEADRHDDLEISHEEREELADDDDTKDNVTHVISEPPKIEVGGATTDESCDAHASDMSRENSDITTCESACLSSISAVSLPSLDVKLEVVKYEMEEEETADILEPMLPSTSVFIPVIKENSERYPLLEKCLDINADTLQSDRDEEEDEVKVKKGIEVKQKIRSPSRITEEASRSKECSVIRAPWKNDEFIKICPLSRALSFTIQPCDIAQSLSDRRQRNHVKSVSVARPEVVSERDDNLLKPVGGHMRRATVQVIPSNGSHKVVGEEEVIRNTTVASSDVMKQAGDGVQFTVTKIPVRPNSSLDLSKFTTFSPAMRQIKQRYFEKVRIASLSNSNKSVAELNRVTRHQPTRDSEGRFISRIPRPEKKTSRHAEEAMKKEIWELNGKEKREKARCNSYICSNSTTWK